MSAENRFSHVLVPHHQLLTKEESEKLLRELGVKAWQLPRIAQDDPAIRDLNPEVGQLVRITRKSELMGEYVVVRLVVPSFSQKAPQPKKEAEEKAEAKKQEKKATSKTKKAKEGSKQSKRGKKTAKKASGSKTRAKAAKAAKEN